MNLLKRIGLLFCVLFVFSCTKDRKFPDLITDAPLGADYKLIHYWNFNDVTSTSTLIKTTYSASSATLEYKGVKYDAVDEGSTINTRNNDVSGNALRLRNPSGDFILNVPTTGFTDVIFRYATIRTSAGPQIQHVYYSLDGTTFIQLGLIDVNYSVTESFVFHSLDFKYIPGANNNPNFKIKIVFETNITGDTGNSRFDNVTLDGIPMPVAKTEQVFQYWNFNNKLDFATPNIGNGSWTFGGASFDDVAGTVLNAQNSEVAGNALRLRNPSGDFILSLPSTGYDRLTLRFAVQRSSTGATSMDINYSTDGTTYTQNGLVAKTFTIPVENTADANLGYAVVTINLTGIPAVNNNSLLKIKFSSVATTGGNSRFDNITLSGFKL